MDEQPRDEPADSVLVFEEDRDDLLRRAMPRTAVGTLGIVCVVVGFVLVAVDDEAFGLGLAAVLAVGLTVLVTLLRVDLYRLARRRPRRYEISQTTFRAFKGDRQRVSIALSDVADWSAPYPVSVGEFWFEWLNQPTALDEFVFVLEGPRSKEVSVTALFRWRDRGGYDDVIAALSERIGPPWNRS